MKIEMKELWERKRVYTSQEERRTEREDVRRGEMKQAFSVRASER